MQAAFLVSACYSGRSPLGSPAKHARPRFARRLPVAAAPALFGVAAAFALANAPAASAAQAPAHAAAKVATAASHSGAAVTRLDTVIRPAAKKTAARPAKYTVKSGDTLSDIAKRVYHNPAYWPVLYWANHSQIKYANIIEVGQKLTVPAKPAKVPAAPSVLGPAAAVHGHHVGPRDLRGVRAGLLRADPGREHLHGRRLVPVVRHRAPSPAVTARS